MSQVAAEMRSQSEAIKKAFATHHLSAGENREDIVAKFLKELLPKRFGVSSGLIYTSENVFSKQADLLIVDEQNNAPLFADKKNKLWPVEAVYCLIEVKTSLNPSDISDAILKCRNYKRLARKFCEKSSNVTKYDDLFVLWAFDCPSLPTLKKNLELQLANVPRDEQPDLVVVPDKVVIQSGLFRETTQIGRPASEYRENIKKMSPSKLDEFLQSHSVVYDYGNNSLLAWFVWLDSWLRRTGPRLTDPVNYSAQVEAKIIS